MTATFSPTLSWAIVLLIVALVVCIFAPLWPSDSHPGASDDSSASARRGGAADGRQR